MSRGGAHIFNKTILREYDIRGIIDDTLTADDAYAIGRAFGTRIARSGGKTVCVGYDGRLSSPEMEQAVVAGLNDCGIDAVRVGLGPTPRDNGPFGRACAGAVGDGPRRCGVERPADGLESRRPRGDRGRLARLGAIPSFKVATDRRFGRDALRVWFGEQQPTRRPCTVPVVGDDPEVVRSMARMVERLGCRSQRALGGVEALELVSRGPPDLIVLDLWRPSTRPW